MARKLPGLRRELDARALFSVAYGEIASSIYFALGDRRRARARLHAARPARASALLFLVVSLSYAEGTAALPETGGAATFVRRASNDLAGFLTGWALFLDYLIVIALSALFLPHYLAGALQVAALDRNPWDVDRRGRGDRRSSRCVRLVRRPSLYGVGIARPGARPADAAPARRARLRAPLLAARADARARRSARIRPGTTLAFALPLAMLAFTGLETVANLAEEARRPGVDLPRSAVRRDRDRRR